MVQILPRRDIAEEIGGSFGKGLGGGTSDQYDRNLLANAIKKAQENPSLIGKYQELFRAPGGAEHAGQLVPILNRASQNNAFMRGEEDTRVQGHTPAVENIPKAATSPIIEGDGRRISPKIEKESSNALTHPEEITRYKQDRLQSIDQKSIDELARMKIGRGEAVDRDEARQLARMELEQNLGAQKEATQSFVSDLNSRVALGLQRSGLGGDSYKDVAGEIQKRLVDEGEYLRFKKGLSSEAASEQIDKIMTDLGKATTSVKAAAELPFSETKGKIQDFKKGKKDFEKYGFGEIYNDMVTAATDITHMETASFLDPIKNESLRKSLGEAVKPKFKSQIPSGGLRQVRHLGDEQMDKIIGSIKPEDNILSVQHFLRDHRIDLADFKRRLTDTHYDKLTDRQKRELGKPVKNSFMGDIFFRAFK